MAEFSRAITREKNIANPQWFKDAVFYEVYVRGFFDSNDDGVGDFRGLTEKLHYLQWLGIDCIWLKDGGYDISDFTSVLPEYGTIEDFQEFLNAAHSRGIRVVADLVVNHTSNEHPWFQESRKSKESSKRDWYVWSEKPEPYKDARIIFVDTETSNWTYDPVAKEYFWHRFFSHQPDLNYDNPEVQEAMLDVVDFWLGMGLDGFRMDAVPYLFEREGTICENLEETHDFLKKLRTHCDTYFPGTLLLAEANQWPSEVVAYYGDPKKGGDECHMCFHFPVMPRLFIACSQEDKAPIVEVLKATPDIPANCQWAIFLRNHDELTLEMCTDEERSLLYGRYASNPRMRCNIGIRRRLAPLMDNNRRMLELMYGLLFSLPGAPFLYYGDEIGLGDNIFLGDRDGVRTPMQWTSDRNAGFSRCDFARLYLPVLMDPVFGHQAINIEAQQRVPSSLLNWVRDTMHIRRRYSSVFGRGTMDFIDCPNHRILAFTRSHKNMHLLCVYNLSRTTQPFSLQMPETFDKYVPVELGGEAQFPEIEGGKNYLLVLPPYAFLWFELAKRDAAGAIETETMRVAAAI